MSVKLELMLDFNDKGAVTGVKALNKEVGILSETTRKAESSTSSMTKAVFLGNIAAKAATEAMRFSIDFTKKSIMAKMESERVERSLAAALEATGRPIQELSDHFTRYANELQQSTIYDDEAIKGAQSLLIQLTNLDKEGIDKATKGAIGLASVMGMDLNSAATVVSKAMAGNVSLLSRYGIQIDSTKTKEEQRVDALQKLEGMYVRATKDTESMGGKLDQLKNTYGDIQEAIGGYITKNFALMDSLKGIADGVLFLLTLDDKLAAQEKNIVDRENDMIESLSKAAVAAGLQYGAMSKLIQAYDGNVIALAKSISKGKEGLALQEALKKVREEEREQFQKKQIELKKLEKGTTNYNEEAEKQIVLIEKLANAYESIPLPPVSKIFNEREQRNQQEYIENLLDIAPPFEKFTSFIDAFNKKQEEQKENMDKVKKSAEELRAEYENMQSQLEAVLGAADNLIGILKDIGVIGTEGADRITSGLMEVAEGGAKAASGIGRIASGDIVGGISDLISAVGKLWSALKKLFGGDGVGEAIKRENQWMDLTKDQIKQLKELEKQYGSTHAATSDMLDQIIRDADVNLSNFDEYASRVREILSDLDQGTMNLSEVQNQIGDAFTELLAQAQKLGTEGSASMIAMFEDLKGRGIEVKEISEYIEAAMQAGLEGYKKMKEALEPGDLQEKYDELSNSIKKMRVGSEEYNKAKKELESLEGQLNDVKNAQEIFGDMNIQVFEDMIAYQKKVEANPALTNAIQGATDALINLSNTTRLNEDQFDQFEQSASGAFDKLIAQGFTSEEAYKQLGPMLSRLKFLHEQYGLTLDESTQKLLDGADAAGVNTQGLMTQEEAFNSMATSLDKLVQIFSGDLPNSIGNTTGALMSAAGAANGFISSMSDLGPIGKGNYLVNTNRVGDFSGPPPRVSAASGYFSPALPRDTVFQAHQGERVEIVPKTQNVRSEKITSVNVTMSGTITPEAVADAFLAAYRKNTRSLRSTLEVK